MMSDPPARAYLFVPGDRPERFAKALASGADAVVLDLEDAVAPPAKDAARSAVLRALTVDGFDVARFVVRINAEETPWFEPDLRAVAQAGAAAVMLPKAERPETVSRLRAASPGTAVLALVESARGVLAVEALAATAGVHRLVFGTLDFALDLGLEAPPPGSYGWAAFDVAASRIAMASRAARLPPPVAGVTTAITDEAALLSDWAWARSHGFGAKLCIHPRQVQPIHRSLVPGADELAWAQRVLAAAALADGAAVLLDGRMIDQPVIERARRLRDRATR